MYRLAFTSEITTRTKLLKEVKASASLKRKADQKDEGVGRMDGQDVKRFIPNDATFECHNCGKPGHKAIDCRSKFTKPAVPTTPNGQSTSTPIPRTSKGVICFRCGENGHIASSCRYGHSGVSGASPVGRAGYNSGSGVLAERRVDNCEIAGVSGQLQ